MCTSHWAAGCGCTSGCCCCFEHHPTGSTLGLRTTRIFCCATVSLKQLRIIHVHDKQSQLHSPSLQLGAKVLDCPLVVPRKVEGALQHERVILDHKRLPNVGGIHKATGAVVVPTIAHVDEQLLAIRVGVPGRARHKGWAKAHMRVHTFASRRSRQLTVAQRWTAS